MLRITTLASFVCLFSVGCSSEDGPPTAPVSGVVTYQGAPVKHAKVVFFPQKVPNGRTSIGITDEEGRFPELMIAGSNEEGAVVGTHFVTVTESWPPGKEIPVDGMGMQRSPPRGPWGQKYRDSSSGALTVDVVADQDNHFEFELTK